MSIEQYQPRAEIALTTSQDVAIHRLGEWAQSASAAHGIAQTLVQTSFCPSSFRGKPGEATAAILAGLEVGLQPMAALRSFDVIQGQAAARAVTLRAIVQSHGHEMVLVESTETRCRMKGKRKGSEEWQTVTWTLDRAKALQLTGKDNWKKQPGAMLVARATSELARLIGSDAILGIAYSAEEITDGASGEQQVDADTATPATPTGTRRMSRKPRAEQVEQGEPEPAEPAQESPMLDPKGNLAKRMFATLNEAGIADRDDRLTYVSSVVGRTITSSSELTAADAHKVIEATQATLDQPLDAELVEDQP